MNPDQIIEFIGYNFDKMEKADDIEDTQYTLTVHDLLSAFRDYDPCASCKHNIASIQSVNKCLHCSNHYMSEWEAKNGK